MSMTWRRVVFGTPLPTARAAHERLPKFLALPIFASDALSSVAYATEEILLVLAMAGAAIAMSGVVPLALAVAVLLAIVATSYRQTIHAYPNGGGAYVVAKENLGTVAGLTAGASLLIDYVLTVAVSVSAGVEALAAAYPGLHPWSVHVCLFFIVLLTIGNLRGVRESGMLFALPTYVFIFSMLALIGIGLFRFMSGSPSLAPPRPPLVATHSLTLFLLLRAFASGCAAMTGVEAVSNGVQAFRPPESRNASATLVWMAGILAVLFLGVSYLSRAYHVYPDPLHHGKDPGTVVSMITAAIVGRNWFFYLIQYSTMAILVLAANTSFAGFPRLGSMIAEERFLPRQLANIGDRLVYSNGIVLLALLASALIVIFRGVTHYLIPLYAIGVFLSFTLSQAGMVRHWMALKEPGWRKSAFINGVGAVCTGIVLVVIAGTKFLLGAWIVVILIPLLVVMFLRIKSHYREVSHRLSLSMEKPEPPRPLRHTVCVLVPSVHRGVIPALAYARSISEDVRGVHVEIEPEVTAKVHEKWARWAPGIPLVVLDSPYRALIEPVMRYLDEVEAERPDDVVTVVIPEFVAPRWWEKLMHNHSGLLLKLALLRKPGIVVTNVRYHLNGAPQMMEATSPATGPARKDAAPRPSGQGVGSGG